MDWVPWLNGEQVAEDVAFTGAVLCAESRRLKDGGALVGRQGAKNIECTAELSLAIERHTLECLGGGADLLPAFGGEALEGFIACHDALADGRRLRVQGM